MRTAIRALLAAALLVALLPAGYFAYRLWSDFYRPVSFVDVAEDRAVLVDGIESYLSVAAFVKALTSRSVAHRVERPPDDQPPDDQPPASGRPPYHVVTVQIPNYTHQGFAGALTVEFFNDRLSSVTFYPADPQAFFADLEARTGLAFHGRQEARPATNSRMWVATDYRGRRYVGWEDTRLADEIRLWIMRYS